jgi:polysaccharide pyruvyl transferase WcaK-like protein
MATKYNGREPVIAVLGHYGNRNLGDESIITATLTGLRRTIPGVVPIAVSMDPADSAHRHGVAAFPVRRGARSPAVADPSISSPQPEPIRRAVGSKVPPTESPSGQRAHDGALVRLIGPLRAVARKLREVVRECLFLIRVWRFVRGVDLVMVTGSNQFLDNFGGAFGYPWTLFKCALVSRLAGTPVAFVSVGAGPLVGRLGRLFARSALRLACYSSWRDEASRELIQGARPDSKRGHVYPDLAFTLRPDVGARGDTVRTIGINPMPVYDARYWPDAHADRYASYVAMMTETVARLRRQGYELFLYAMQPGDEHVIDDIAAALRETGAGWAVPIHAPADVDELFDLLRTADLLVPTRFHGTVLGLTCGRPVFSVCYHRKTSDVMDTAGLVDSVIAIDEIDVDRMVAGINALADRVPDVYIRIDEAVATNRAQLEEQFRSIADLVCQARDRAAEPEVKPS